MQEKIENQAFLEVMKKVLGDATVEIFEIHKIFCY
jgi:hypothetical protein